VFPHGPLTIASYTQVGVFERTNKDPINLVFAGRLSNLAETLKVIESDPLWCLEDKGVGNQVFGEPSAADVWHTQDINRATKFLSNFSGRLHIRAYAMHDEHRPMGRLVAAGIHRESWARCGWKLGDAVGERGFDEARDEAVEAFERAGYDVVQFGLASFDPVLQCNGHWADTDGFGALIAERGFLSGLGLPVGWPKAVRHA
jgi:hypothetical protein